MAKKKKEEVEEVEEKKIKKKKPKKKVDDDVVVEKKKKTAKKKKELKIVDDDFEDEDDDDFDESYEPDEEEESGKVKHKKEKKEKPKPDWYTDDEHTRNWMMLANATYIGAIITYISTKDREDLDMEMIRFQVVQGLFSNICMLFWPLFLVVALIAVLKAKDGECWEMPVFGEWARKALGMELKEKKEKAEETDDEE